MFEEDLSNNLDFYLMDYDVYLEVKSGHSDRSQEQLGRDHNVILIQGKKSIKWLMEILKK